MKPSDSHKHARVLSGPAIHLVERQPEIAPLSGSSTLDIVAPRMPALTAFSLFRRRLIDVNYSCRPATIILAGQSQGLRL